VERAEVHIHRSYSTYNNYKAIVDYTSPALCTPFTPFPPMGDAAYRQRTGRRPIHGHRQRAQEIGKDHACGSGDILAERQTDTQTDILITIPRNRSRWRSKNRSRKS